MDKNLDTVGDLIDALKKYRRDLPLEAYDDMPRGVTLMHVRPDEEEKADGSYEVLMVCHDTLPTHSEARDA